MADFLLDKLGISVWLDNLGIGGIVRFMISLVWAVLVVYVIFKTGRLLFAKRLKKRCNCKNVFWIG